MKRLGKSPRRLRTTGFRPQLDVLEDRMVLSPGMLDPTFDGDGKVTTRYLLGDSHAAASDVALQNDGKILAVGGFGDIVMHRYLPDGRLDPAFGTNGSAGIEAIGDIAFISPRAIALERGGKILVSGPAAYSNTGFHVFAVARFNSNGSPDTTFGTDGVAVAHFATSIITDLETSANALDMALQSDGKIVVVGSAIAPFFGYHAALVRYNTDGTLDTSFDSDGIVTTYFGGTNIPIAVAIQADGKIVVTGFTSKGSFLARYTQTGALDPTFAGGIVTAPGAEFLADLQIQSDGKIVAVGTSLFGGFATYRYLSAGILDASFGTGGVVITNVGSVLGTITTAGTVFGDIATGVAVQDNGKIVVTGAAHQIVVGLLNSTGDSVFATVRYTSDGVLDTGFGDGGIVTTHFDNEDSDWQSAQAVAIQCDGKIVVAGGASSYDFALARYEGDPVSCLSINNITVREGNSGTLNAIFTVTRAGDARTTAGVNYAIANGSAAAGADYTAVSGALIFLPGERSKTISVAVRGDTMYEQDETFFVNLSRPSGAKIGKPQGVATIVNNDSRPKITIGDATVAERHSGRVAVMFTVLLSNASYQAVTVNYATADKTARAGEDYEAASGTLTFNSGQTTKTITVWIRGDTKKESAETFCLNLSAANKATILDGQAVAIILNDD